MKCVSFQPSDRRHEAACPDIRRARGIAQGDAAGSCDAGMVHRRPARVFVRSSAAYHGAYGPGPGSIEEEALARALIVQGSSLFTVASLGGFGLWLQGIGTGDLRAAWRDQGSVPPDLPAPAAQNR